MLALYMGTVPIWRLRQYRHQTKSAPGGVQGRAALRAGAKGKLCPHRRRLDSGSFPPGTQVVKPEIHTVFLGFPTFFPKKNLSLSALADGSKASPQLSASPGRVLCFLSWRNKKGRPPAGVGEHFPLSQHLTRTQCCNNLSVTVRFAPGASSPFRRAKGPAVIETRPFPREEKPAAFGTAGFFRVL